MKKRLLLGVSLSVGLAASAFAESHVTVYLPEQAGSVTVDGARNLSELVMNPALFNRTWWPGTVIAAPQATVQQQAVKQAVLASLSALAAAFRQDDDGDLAAAADNLHQQVSQLTVTGRQFVPLDPDDVRIHPEHNRRLEGEYSVYTLQRPTTVRLFGLVENSGPQPFVPAQDAKTYLDNHAPLAGYDKNQVWLIQPDGTTRQVPVAYWNHRRAEPAPGSTLFVGFSAQALPSAYRDLNLRILALLTNRVPD
ncbi:hypothetical protein CYR55_21270 [Chimaeribacter californicus]|uniref:Uncharacterized protein n=1 Tax=Chimaeribacter californicus TaxID=2060067 RepID=A0A2N5DVQ1_9GAMM|nr:capsule biosynthesis GfcC D2 domain-containing protein [Chimaeribacter californicus]PLR31136.1 hypothetical protein CYR55_21270 [Chimaeribacter californicus]